MTASIPSKSILCVQGDEEDRALLAELLQHYRLVFACNAYEALRELGRGVFDGYVLDLWLSDWSGAQLCREVRKLDPHGPILFCTAAARTEDRNRAMRAGGSAYLCKPVDPSRLLAQLRVLLELADLESIRARIEASGVTQAELERRAAEVFKRTGESRRSAVRAVERISKAKASIAFSKSGGTKANFERWWPTLFAGAWANIQAVASDGAVAAAGKSNLSCGTAGDGVTDHIRLTTIESDACVVARYK
ncbi:MAG: DNA-binding response regulator [Betaproteobacteria bacterium]|jgi:CheY-like chemotaxis protein|nr:DNA-binding response regulator [Betaproteobacteria bacterium]